MSCCRAEEYKWCSKNEVVFTDSDGNEYCIFHAPKDKKGDITVEEFNNIIFKKMRSALEDKAVCDLSGTVFPGSFKYHDKTIPDIRFFDAVFNGAVHFARSKFTSFSTFAGANFNDGCMFDRVQFQNIGSFYSAKFGNHSYFSDSKFSNIVNFSNSIFYKSATFLSIQFDDEVGFEETEFLEDAHFSSCVFNKATNFFKIKFREDSSFKRNIFNNSVNFTAANFEKQCNFTEEYFGDKISFVNSEFKDKVKFSENIFIRSADFNNTIFENGAEYFRNTIDQSITFLNVNFSCVKLYGSNPINMKFFDCRFRRKFGRNIIYDETLAGQGNMTYGAVEEIYRSLKQKYINEQNQIEISNWHYGEKEMFRKKYWWRRYFPFSISNLYWFSSGYGERPVRSGLILISVLLGVSLISGVLGLVPNENKSVSNIIWIQGLPWSLSMKQLGFLLYNTFQNALFIKEPFFIPSSISGNIFLNLCTKIIIPLQTALFVLSVRNKFRR